MRYYKDLDLEKIRDACDIDFAHYTYEPGMCACCFGPENLSRKFWKNGIILRNNYEYILFKNADNGSGHVNAYHPIHNKTHIEWDFDMSKMDKICRMLLEQLGDEYYVRIPKSDWHCITVMTFDNLDSDAETDKYRILTYADLDKEE